jgi:hypothetical protein
MVTVEATAKQAQVVVSRLLVVLVRLRYRQESQAAVGYSEAAVTEKNPGLRLVALAVLRPLVQVAVVSRLVRELLPGLVLLELVQLLARYHP